MFAVLHVDTSEDFVKKAPQVTSSHVKLCQPTFSSAGVMIRVKLGLPVKVHYEALIHYFEVFLRNADGDYNLRLDSEGKKKSRRDTVWTCTIRKSECFHSSFQLIHVHPPFVFCKNYCFFIYFYYI